MSFDWVAKPASMLLNQLLEKWEMWDKCRRWYKWLSIIQLLVAYIMLFASGALFHAGVILVTFGGCCYAAGVGAGKTDWFEVDRYGNRSYSHTEDNGAFCKFVAGVSQAYGWSCLVACFACYCLSWIFLALTFIFLYEEIDLTAEVEYFVLINDKKYPLEMNLYPKMDRKVAKVGAVKRTDIIRGRKVYTGWVKLETEGEFWLYCNRRVAAATTEVEGVPMVNNAPTQPGDYRCVVPIETKADIEAQPIVVLDSHVLVVDPAESA